MNQHHINIPPVSLFDLIAEAPGQLLRIKRPMIQASHELEQAAVAAKAPCQVFAGFQRFSLFAKQTQRYAALAPHWAQCWVFGEADVLAPHVPGVKFVSLPAGHQLLNEWFVVVDGPKYGAALITADISGFAIADAEHRFMGRYTDDLTVVRSATARLTDALGLSAPTWESDGSAATHGEHYRSDARHDDAHALGSFTQTIRIFA